VTEREIMEARRAHCSTAEWERAKYEHARSLPIGERMRLAESLFRDGEQLQDRIDERKRARVRAVRNRVEPTAEAAIRKLSELRWPGPPGNAR